MPSPKSIGILWEKGKYFSYKHYFITFHKSNVWKMWTGKFLPKINQNKWMSAFRVKLFGWRMMKGSNEEKKDKLKNPLSIDSAFSIRTDKRNSIAGSIFFMNSFSIDRNVFGHDFTSKSPLNPTHAKIKACKKTDPEKTRDKHDRKNVYFLYEIWKCIS